MKTPRKPESQFPLRCEVVGEKIIFEIGVDILKVAAFMHPNFWDGESGTDVPNIRVTDPMIFAREVVRQVNDEDEDGSTLLTRMLDEAMKQAVEDGCEGVDHE